MRAALKILSDVLAYRLRRLEMANMVAAVAIMLALRLPWPAVAVRSLFALGLNLLAYLTNDYCDVEDDLAAARDPEKTRFLADHLTHALGTQLALALILAALALVYRPGLLAALVLGAGLCWIYSAWLKRVPFADVAAMTLWGGAMLLVAFDPNSTLGWCLIAELALFSTCFELIQVIRDHDQDRARGFVTTAVYLGPERTLALARAAMVLAGVYAVCVLDRWAGFLIFVAPLLPMNQKTPERYWNRVRLVFGTSLILTLARVYLSGSSAGLFVNVSRDARLF